MARTKTVYPKEQVAHLWANNENSPEFVDIRTATGNLYTAPAYNQATAERAAIRDSAIWSYGSHYCLARHARDRNGAPVVLFNQNGYSTTTQRHCSLVRRALPPRAYAGGLFTVLKPQASNAREHAENFADYKSRYESAMLDSAAPRIRADTRAAHVAKADSLRDEANRYAHAFRLRARIKDTTPAAIRERVAREVAKADRQREQARIAAELRAVEERAEFMAMLPMWRAGTIPTHELPNRYAHGYVGMRLEPNLAFSVPEQVETTRGARFPAEDARKLWPLILAAVSAGREFVPGGLRTVSLGSFRLTRIEANGDVIAGCHTVPYAECRALARTLGLITE